MEPPSSLAQAILTLCERGAATHARAGRRGARKSAEKRGQGELGGRAHLLAVRRVAVELAEAGRIGIYRKGKPVDPGDFRGVYRLGAARLG